MSPDTHPRPHSVNTPPTTSQSQPAPRSASASASPSPHASPTHPPAPPQMPTTTKNNSNSNLKRKTPPSHAGEDIADVEPDDRKPLVLPPGADLPAGLGAGEYAAGRVLCAACGAAVSFRDEGPGHAGGTFTLRHWEAHRLSCPSAGASANANASSQSQHAHPHSHPLPHAHQASYAHAHAHAHAHALSYPPPPAPSPLSVSAPGPPLKRRRAKRTEEERIAYLRADTHVAQFEAYRVLCASCDKWIRLRPNSTYCSIPWDAHRKSCLAKKMHSHGNAAAHSQGAGNGHANARPASSYARALEELARDPNVRRVEADRLLCAMCEKWIALPLGANAPDADPSAQHQVWQAHRAACQKTVAALRSIAAAANGSAPRSPPPARERPLSSSSGASQALPPTAPHAATHAPAPAPAPPSQSQPQPHPPPPPPPPPHHTHPQSVHAHAPPAVRLPLPDAPHLVMDLSPSNYAAPHESRRRNAEQRAATLRADVLIRAVEPNRVFCSLCTKWVQLRQDSSYCAYPWLQHRGKCLARYQRRAQRASELAAQKGGRRPPCASGAPPVLPRASVDEEEPESEEGAGGPGRSPRRPAPPAHPPRAIPAGYAAAAAPAAWPKPKPKLAAAADGHGHGHGESERDGDGDGEGDDVDADGDSYMEDDAAPASANGNARVPPTPSGASASAILRRAMPAGLADLDSPSGRRGFVWASVEYLFRTTHEASDDLSVSALLAYVNAAMPTDKHEDFDTGEVARAAAALAARGRSFVLEGDMIRVRSGGEGA
ncbi:hypothetical protein GGX14DRAFT_696581 [Mycena pura]|uniref:Uncharacterized protein n=1 Tax=Mycena pura TaxID=153505 RepID=A0AAD6YG21_9AGAR|nr:hypothetical protein GGX14DRAFT_696581 [Mycena pura]